MGRGILFVTTDQQRYDALGCNGGAIARTPVIDGLAAAEDFFAAFERTELVVRVVGVDILEVGTLVGGHDDCLLGGERRSRSR
mgnify:CR=1 FL=1